MCDVRRVCFCVCVCVSFFFRFFILFCELRREYWWMHKLERRTKNKSVRVVVDGSLVSSFCKHILIKHRAHYWNDSDNDDGYNDDDDDSDSGNNATTTDRMLFIALRCSGAVVFISFKWEFWDEQMKNFVRCLTLFSHIHARVNSIFFSSASRSRLFACLFTCTVGLACEKLSHEWWNPWVCACGSFSCPYTTTTHMLSNCDVLVCEKQNKCTQMQIGSSVLLPARLLSFAE